MKSWFSETIEKGIFLAVIVSVVSIPYLFDDVFAEIEYRLDVETYPKDLFHIEGAGKYVEGTQVTIGTAPEEWEGLRFVGWKVDGIFHEGNPIQINMNEPHKAVAWYSDEKYLITIDAIPRQVDFIVDGEIYSASELPLEFEWDNLSTHDIQVKELLAVNSTRYKFTAWNDLVDNPARRISVDSSRELKAFLDTEYLVVATSKYGQVTGSGWYPSGSEANVSVPDEYLESATDGIRYAFTGWSDGYNKNSIDNTLVVTSPTVVEASWREQYLLRIKSLVSDVVYENQGWYEKESLAPIFAPKEIEVSKDRLLYTFAGWSTIGENAAFSKDDLQETQNTIRMDAPHTVWTNWDKQVYLDIIDPYGIIKGSGYYNAGDIATIVVENEEKELTPNKVRVEFAGFEGDIESESTELEILMEEPVTISTIWDKQYFLKINSRYGGTIGEGWHDEGRLVTFGISDYSNPAGLWTENVFAGWSGDYTGLEDSGEILMTESKTITTEWKADGTIAIMNIGVISAVAVGGIFAFIKFRKSKFGSLNLTKSKPKDDSDSKQEVKEFEKIQDIEEPIQTAKKEIVGEILSEIEHAKDEKIAIEKQEMEIAKEQLVNNILAEMEKAEKQKTVEDELETIKAKLIENALSDMENPKAQKKSPDIDAVKSELIKKIVKEIENDELDFINQKENKRWIS